MPPQRGVGEETEVDPRQHTSDISRLTSDHHDERQRRDERCRAARRSLRRGAISAGSNVAAVVGALADERIVRRRVGGDRLGRRSPRPRAAPRASARASHHRPKPSMMTEAMMPSPGAANGVVPKNGMGIAFWIAGVPGSADMVKVEVPSAIAAGIRRFGMSAARNSACAIGAEHEEGDEQADAAVGDERAGQHHRQHRAARAELSRSCSGDRGDRAAVLHQLAEHRAEQEQRKELREEAAPPRP